MRFCKLLKDWWTWSGSNRRPLPCHERRFRTGGFSLLMARRTDGKKQCFISNGSLPISRHSGTNLSSASDLAILHSSRLNNCLTRLTQEKHVSRYPSADENG